MTQIESRARPIVVISRCIDFDACRYNGQIIRATLREELEPHVSFRPICPELEIGLGVPRDPIRLVRSKGRSGERRLIQPSSGRDLTDVMSEFTERHLGALGSVDGFILKGRSPSCGVRDAKVHPDEHDNQVTGRGPGVFAAGVLDRFPATAIEDEVRLRNARFRDHFLTRIFASADFRAVVARRSIAELGRFHARNKLLFMSRGQQLARSLGLTVAGGGRPFEEVVAAYGRDLAAVLARPSRVASNVNVLMHALGQLSARLSPAERKDFLDSLDAYRAGRLSLSGPLSVLCSWAARFENAYLAEQSFLSPYPRELVLDD